MADLASLPRAAVVVEDRYSQVFALDRVRPAVVAEAIAECQAGFPAVPIIFAENRQLAQEWTYRFLAAAQAEIGLTGTTDERLESLTPPPAPSPAEIRDWARAQGLEVSSRGRIPQEIRAAFERR